MIPYQTYDQTRPREVAQRAASSRPMLPAHPTYPRDFYMSYLILNHPANSFSPQSPCLPPLHNHHPADIFFFKSPCSPRSNPLAALPYIFHIPTAPFCAALQSRIRLFCTSLTVWGRILFFLQKSAVRARGSVVNYTCFLGHGMLVIGSLLLFGQTARSKDRAV